MPPAETRRIREASGLSTHDLARLFPASTPTSAASISRWETCLARPRTKAALAWARILEALLLEQERRQKAVAAS